MLLVSSLLSVSLYAFYSSIDARLDELIIALRSLLDSIIFVRCLKICTIQSYDYSCNVHYNATVLQL